MFEGITGYVTERVRLIGRVFGTRSESSPETFDELINEYENNKQELVVGLDSGRRDDKAISKIDLSQRKILYFMPYRSQAKKFFTDERVEEMTGLLRRASEYLQGTEYEESSMGRDSSFRGDISAILRFEELCEMNGVGLS